MSPSGPAGGTRRRHLAAGLGSHMPGLRWCATSPRTCRADVVAVVVPRRAGRAAPSRARRRPPRGCRTGFARRSAPWCPACRSRAHGAQHQRHLRPAPRSYDHGARPVHDHQRVRPDVALRVPLRAPARRPTSASHSGKRRDTTPSSSPSRGRLAGRRARSSSFSTSSPDRSAGRSSSGMARQNRDGGRRQPSARNAPPAASVAQLTRQLSRR